MSERQKPLVTVALIVVIVIALAILLWQLLGQAGAGRVAESVYPQPMEGQPTVEEVGPPPDVVPAATPGTPAQMPLKGR